MFSLLEQLDIPYPEDNEECSKHFHRPERDSDKPRFLPGAVQYRGYAVLANTWVLTDNNG